MQYKVSIIGGGAWGTSLALIAANAGNKTIIYSRNSQIVEEINTNKTNTSYLPGISLPSQLSAINEISNLVDSKLIIITTPSLYFRESVKSLKTIVNINTPIVIATKGIEQDSIKLMSEIVEEELNTSKIAILSGPNFAHEIAKKLPAAATLACSNKEVAEEIITTLSNHYFKLYYSSDIITSQLAGAFKKRPCHGCGIIIGQNLGDNAKSMLITNGLIEMAKICVAMGGNADNLLSLAALGDTILTCNSLNSRNTSFGLNIALGKNIDELITNSKGVIEGVNTSKSVNQLIAKYQIEMPIFHSIYQIINNQLTIEEFVSKCLNYQK